MEKVIDVEFTVMWSSPVFVHVGYGMPERIDGPEAALSTLLHRWPANARPEFEVAKRHCVEALTHHGSADLARSAFINAAAAAKVLT
ncbi:DUF982 domain-containing protein [Neorhizobium sp. LMR1-1-1.1]